MWQASTTILPNIKTYIIPCNSLPKKEKTYRYIHKHQKRESDRQTVSQKTCNCQSKKRTKENSTQ